MSYSKENFRTGMIFFGAVILAWLYHIASMYPYYFSWDMDLVTTEDFLIVGSGQIPDHQIHPGVGMLLVLKYLSYVAKYFGFLSATRLEDLSTSVTPILLMANATTWVRWVSPLIVFLIGLLSSAALIRYFRLPKLTSIGLLIVFGLSFSSSFHAAVSRTEQYSVLFLICAWFCLLAANLAEPLKVYLRYLYLSGFFMGLAYISKVQCLVLLAATFLFYFHLSLNRTSQSHQKSEQDEVQKSKFFHKLIVVNFSVFFLFSVLGALVRITSSIQHERDSFGVTPWWLAIFSFLSGSLIYRYFEKRHVMKWSRGVSQLIHVCRLTHVLVFGALSSFFVHLLLYRDVVQGIRHLLLTFKITMFGAFKAGKVAFIVSQHSLQNFLSHKYLLFLFVFTVVLILIQITVTTERKKRLSYLSGLGIWLFLSAHIVLATRSLASIDIIWAEIPILFFGFYFICYLDLEKPKPWLRHS